MSSARIIWLLVLFGGLGFILSPIPSTSTVLAQQTESKPARLVGTITAIKGDQLTIRPDSGETTTVTVSEKARVLRAKPGAKTVAGSTQILFSDLVIGDRVLMAVRPAPDGSGNVATVIIAMTQADITRQHMAEEAAWQTRGVGGIAKAVDPAANTITIINNQNHPITIHVTPKTVIRRYAPGSVQFSDTQLATIDQIHPGDQVRALGEHEASGSEIQAEKVVAGTFRNIAGRVLSTDPAAKTITVRDFATKQPVTVQINPESTLHKLPAATAQMLAARFGKAQEEQHGTGKGHGHGEAAESAPKEPSATSTGERGPGPNISQMLQQSPVIQISDLHKGDDVMIVAQGNPGSSVVAATLLAGVEPIFAASSSASRNLFSASWDLGGQGATGNQGGDQGGDQSGGGSNTGSEGSPNK